MRSSGVTFTFPAEIMAMPRFHATTKLSRRMMDRWESHKLFSVTSCLLFVTAQQKQDKWIIYLFYLLAFSTLQGSRMVSPATNLNVSERDIKLGSGVIRWACKLELWTVNRKEIGKSILETIFHQNKIS